jgi:type I restriction enzyme M protein
MIETLNEHGRGGIILPHGVLFRGSSEGKIRKHLIEENLLKAVVGLPANLFFGTGIPATILIFDKNKGKNTDVLFIDASNEFENGKNQNKLRDTDIEKIYNTYHNWETIDKYSFVASFKEIKENDFNLNIPRYVDTFEEQEPVDIQQTQQEISRLRNELSQVEGKMSNYLAKLGY